MEQKAITYENIIDQNEFKINTDNSYKKLHQEIENIFRELVLLEKAINKNFKK